ncbi:MAG: endolytic transglycosylase MltG [Proteobacteria bacterium SW_6_67_9]|nr:MAG: endolytic transglycosylase MltG [Proteobacteria bacterium SW_6_67_9]
MSARWRRWLLIGGGLALALAVAAAVAAVDVFRFLHSPMEGVPDDGAIYRIEPGTPVAGIAAELAERGLIERPSYLRLTARLSGAARRLQAGEYAIEPGMTPYRLLERFESGRVKQHSLTIIEGWTFHQVVSALRDAQALTHEVSDQPPERIMESLGHGGEHPEGRFFPDTYNFPRGTTDRALLQRAYDRMARVLERAWAERQAGLPLDGPYDALILASIIERETGVPEERRRIGGVFVERLEQGMLLQTDPTVIYGLGGDYTGDITYEHLRRDTPYNTYTRAGLPPTPIAMPSEASIEAAVDPERRGELYFVSTGEGEHVFSKTLEEHERAVDKYQLDRGRGGSEE